MLTNLIVVNILQFIRVLNHLIVYIKLTQCRMSITSIKLGEKKEKKVISEVGHIYIKLCFFHDVRSQPQ